jgi:RNA polymerase sigma factor (TIGR02999 family)
MVLGNDGRWSEIRMVRSGSGDITRLLVEWQSGDAAALDDLIPLVYDELRALASAHLAREHGPRTLQPTALVHEAWMRLAGSEPGHLASRNHFFATAAAAMRRILVEQARRRRTRKRGRSEDRITLELDGLPTPSLEPDVLDVHRALEDLARIADRQARMVELRFFGGLTVPESAEVLGVSLATAERDWTAARHWLRRRLQGPATTPERAAEDA